jgi:hypothetical protein
MRSISRAGLLAALLAVAGFARAGDANWSVRVTPYDQVYPALEMSRTRAAQAGNSPLTGNTFGAGSGLVAVNVHARHDGERVRVDIDAPGLLAPASIEATLAGAGQDYELRPPLAWDAARLNAMDVARSAPLHFALSRDGAYAGALTIMASLRPLSEALYFVRDGRDTVDLSWIFAAYVDEGDPVVQQVLDIALQNGIVDKFDGYAGSTGAVYRQAWAVWQALAAHGIRYSAADPGIARGPSVFSQRVRLLEQTWGDRSANCVDGSVLIASVLQRIGLRSFLVLVPGHAFVGFYTDPEATHAAYLETTLLGAPSPRIADLPGYADTFDDETSRRLDIAGFAAALEAGRRRFLRDAARLDNRHRPDYAVIDIGQARAFGVVPIRTNAGAEVSAGAISSP